MQDDSTTEKRQPGSLHPGRWALEVNVQGATRREAWDNLLALVTYAIECKNAQKGLWPHMVMTDAGKITVKAPNVKAEP